MFKDNLTKFIVFSYDYFLAETDDGYLRFGLYGVVAVQVSVNHVVAPALLACESSEEVEAIFDEVQSGVYYGGKQTATLTSTY